MRTVYLPLDEIYGQIANVLRPYIGVVAEIADYKPILESVLENYFYGHSLSKFETLEYLKQLKLPTDLAKELDTKITTTAIQTIVYGFQVIYPARNYEYRFIGDDIAITEIIPVILTLCTDVQHDSEDDGYTPERLRLQRKG